MGLNESRRRLIAMEKRARAKMARLKKQNNADIKGSVNDPTRGSAKIRRYNSKQLAAHSVRLERFLSRNVQFYGDKNGKLIPAGKWRLYKKLEGKVNERSSAFLRSVAGHNTPSNVRVDFYHMMYRTKSPHLHNRSVNSPFMQAERQSKNIASPGKLDALIESYKNRLSPSYRARQIKQARSEMRMALEGSGWGDLADEADELSDKAFERLWFYSSEFADAVSTIYHIKVLGNHDPQMDPAMDNVANQAKKDIRGMFSWAKRGFRGQALG